MIKVLREFYLNGKIGFSVNSTFITLIPKKDLSTEVSDHCPISLVTSMCKIITKVLSLSL